MHPNAELLQKFYSSFQQLDYQGMQACYHPDIHFADPAFPDLNGGEAKAMWHMLCERAQEFKLTFNNIQADDTQGQAHWEATYIFSSTGRKVHNIIDAKVQFKNGLIIKHNDHFDFWRWSRQAIGPMGLLLGWSPFLKKKVQTTAGEGLAKFIEKHPEY